MLGVSLEHLNFVLYRSPSSFPYRTFTLRKRSGGTRTINAPPQKIKAWQKILSGVFSDAYRPRPPAYGFVQGRSIVGHAKLHRGKRWVLNIDIEDFFPTIHFGRVRGLLMAAPYGLPVKVATLLARICCDPSGQLPQGAPTSPIISNMICVGLDQALANLVSRRNCTYSRYADDISFSSNDREFPPELATVGPALRGEGLILGDALVQAVEQKGFRINRAKSRLQHRHMRQEVTGLTVNIVPNVNRRFLDEVRGALHAWEIYGYSNAQQVFERRASYRQRFPGNEPPALSQVLRGKIEFIRSVKTTESATFRGVANRLNRLDPRLITAYPPVLRGPSEGWWHQLQQFYEPLVFHLQVQKDGRWGSGTAFAWAPNLLATASHCLDGNVTVSPPEEDLYVFPQGVLRYHQIEDGAGDRRRDPDRDVGILQLREAITPCSWPLRESALQLGEEIAALGFATVDGRLPSLGIYTGRIEAFSRPYDAATDSIQASIQMAGGMSGGPVIDRQGRLIGIVVEHSFEAGQGGRAFHHVLPIKYLLQLSRDPDSCVRIR